MKNNLFLLTILVILGCYSCLPEEKEIIPKPLGYYRLPEPKKEYQLYDSTCPFIFEYPVYAKITPYKKDLSKTCWFDIQFPIFNATIYMSYENMTQNPRIYFEDSRTLVYSHTVKANGIIEFPIKDDARKVYGVIYKIEGDAASNYQFHLTDSLKHFLRGSLYFNTRTNVDSIAPALDFIRKDVDHLTQTLRWK